MISRAMRFRAARALLPAALAFVSLGPLFAQNGLLKPGSAKVIAMTGRVSVLKDGAEWARSVGDIVEPQQVIVTGPDGYAKFQLEDGSTFEVFQNSRAIFHETPGWDEMLKVLLGRVKVYVDHSNGPNHKRVTTQTAIISVRGTLFDVVVEDEDGTTLISVDEGIVDVRHQIFGGNPVELHPGESIRVFRDQRLAARTIDKGSFARGVLRAAAQAVYDVLYGRATVGVGGTAGTASAPVPPAQGDKGKNPTGSAPPPPIPGSGP
jgi:ferric-dicitrate binding protein FerR (iron transport regulator)